MDPTAPELQEKIVTALERDRNFDQAAVEREILNENYKEGSAWYAHNQDNPEAVKLAETLTQKALYTAAYFTTSRRRNMRSPKNMSLRLPPMVRLPIFIRIT